ncbi:hypothetical protein GNY06_06705 [Elizabethkingia argentiflava]|uniref:GSCFA domain-containing protein n=1 Tax=Elizabethkingia argenteiflava TaxID=2681556 RepID=A0A845PS76_9FLAO|nr:GSCFA domain-containing protein [Elizabethkingia argenteiflava]NAW51072.1 hypothetical protein [Elizabethkingia argenteiflava]
MMFRTEIQLAESKQKIQAKDRIFSIGSCFATEIASIFALGELQTLNNPFGTLFHPVAIHTALKKIHQGKEYKEEDLIYYQSKYMSLDHHSQFDDRYLHKSLERINSALNETVEFLRDTRWVIITYGTSWVYEFTKHNKIVANCHKIPQQYFRKRLLSHTEIIQALSESLAILKDIASHPIQILFSISPVRHTKDGIVENQRSKSRLINTIHEVVENYSFCEYLPIYEILMDDLRDYRFYKEDLIHPNSQAIQYIWEKFSHAYIEPETLAFINENLKINRALSHRPFDPHSEETKLFNAKLQERISLQQCKVRHKIFKNQQK